jgi:hypothetical protein
MYDKPKHQNLPYNLKCKYLKKNYSKFSSIFFASICKWNMIMFVLMLDSFENSYKKNNKNLCY